MADDKKDKAKEDNIKPRYVRFHGWLIPGHLEPRQARLMVEAPGDAHVGHAWWGGETVGFVYRGHDTAEEVTIVHHLKDEDRP